MMTLSRTVMLLKMVVSWKVRTTPLRAAMWGARFEMLSPLKRTSPDVGLRKDEISLNSVDLPAPLGPMMERISLSRTENETSLTATRPPKRIVRLDTSSSAATFQPFLRPHAEAEETVRQDQHQHDHRRRIDQQLELAGFKQQVPAEIKDQS